MKKKYMDTELLNYVALTAKRETGILNNVQHYILLLTHWVRSPLYYVAYNGRNEYIYKQVLSK